MSSTAFSRCTICGRLGVAVFFTDLRTQLSKDSFSSRIAPSADTRSVLDLLLDSVLLESRAWQRCEPVGHHTSPTQPQNGGRREEELLGAALWTELVWSLTHFEFILKRRETNLLSLLEEVITSTLYQRTYLEEYEIFFSRISHTFITSYIIRFGAMLTSGRELYFSGNRENPPPRDNFTERLYEDSVTDTELTLLNFSIIHSSC